MFPSLIVFFLVFDTKKCLEGIFSVFQSLIVFFLVFDTKKCLEGIFSVFQSLIPKFVAIPASALPLAIINMLGFVPPKEPHQRG